MGKTTNQPDPRMVYSPDYRQQRGHPTGRIVIDSGEDFVIRYFETKNTIYQCLSPEKGIFKPKTEKIQNTGAQCYVSFEKRLELLGIYSGLVESGKVSLDKLVAIIQKGRNQGFDELGGCVFAILTDKEDPYLRWSSKVLRIDPPFKKDAK